LTGTLSSELEYPEFRVKLEPQLSVVWVPGRPSERKLEIGRKTPGR